MPTILHAYKNGNTNISIYDDGTKIREYDGAPKPQHPESCDVKITNRCDGVNGKTCQFCHEKSHIFGKEADLNKLMSVISDLPAGVELAIGGGNTLSHPHLNEFLGHIKERGLIANITVNQAHINRHKSQLIKLINYGMIYGVGISCSPINDSYLQDIKDICKMSSNVVFHLINGINTLEDIDQLINVVGNEKCKILVLGYKKWGMGKRFYDLNKVEIENKISKYEMYLHRYFKMPNIVMSFDNLSIEQLRLKRYFTEEGWEKFFMGQDGRFTMYIDAVEQQYAKSSTSEDRVGFDQMGLREYFQSLSARDK
jgi:hypothetical protein